MPITGFSHWTLTVSDLERSSEFYRDVMGWRPVGAIDEAPDDAWGPLPGRESSARVSRRFIRDGQRVEVQAFPGATLAPRPTPQVNHLGLSHMTVPTGPAMDVMRGLLGGGVRVRTHTLSTFMPSVNEGSQFLFEDPDGNLIETYAADEDWNAFGGVGEAEDDDGSRVGIRHLSHWSLCVVDPTRSLPFYTNLLGWQEQAAMDWEGPGPSTVMDVGPARLTTWLLTASGERIEIIFFSSPMSPGRTDHARPSPGLSHLTVVVDDVDGVARDLAAASVEPTITKGRDGEAVLFEDPDGNVIRGVPIASPWR
jgi:catechol 2,3-dioxygenase-like lactoylglutathione lyase family enzyme